MFGRSAWRSIPGFARSYWIRREFVTYFSRSICVGSANRGFRSARLELDFPIRFSAQNEANTMKMGTSLRKMASLAVGLIYISAWGSGSAATANAQDAGKHAITFADMMKN